MTATVTKSPDPGMISAVLDWARQVRRAVTPKGGLGALTEDDVAQMAHDVGVSEHDLQTLVRRGPDAVAELPRMLEALHLDYQTLRRQEPLVLRDLQRLCSGCEHKSACRHDLAAGTAAEHFPDYCANAHTLEALQAETAAASDR